MVGWALVFAFGAPAAVLHLVVSGELTEKSGKAKTNA